MLVNTSIFISDITICNFFNKRMSFITCPRSYRWC
nr:MAG TPA: hypothetical protein [Bacteriophage sp.]